MAPDGPRDESAKRGDPEVADAGWLFRDEPATSPASPAGSASPGGGAGSAETFDLVASPLDEPEAGAAAPPIPTVPARERPAARPRDADRPKSARAGEAYPIEPEAAVDVVWSRGAEWGPSLMALAAWMFAVALVVYFLLGWEVYGLAFLALVAGGAVALLLSYPILITLERPVRITPEQAIRDFYGALSHHMPHYRRMWLLLARTGRTSSSYGSFEGFKSYWKEKIATLKGDKVGSFTPLVFEVENYRGDKSAGKSRVEVGFTLKVSVRGHRRDGPIASIPGQVSLIRGPDKMWYLESGTLPHAQREPRGR